MLHAVLLTVKPEELNNSRGGVRISGIVVEKQ